jgi:hypothetical protein
MFKWLFFECLLPLSPVLAFYLFLWLYMRDLKTWVPIKDGQVCFFCTTTAVIAIRDLAPVSAKGAWWLGGPLIPMILSLFVYCAAIFTTLKPEEDKKTQGSIDRNISIASLLCLAATILVIGGLRYSYGLFNEH